MYRGTYLEMAGESMVAKSLKEKCINAEVKLVFKNIEDLQEICSTLDIFYEHLKNIAWVLLPIVNFRRYRVSDNVSIKEFHSLLRATMKGAKSFEFLKMLVNERSFTIIATEDASNRLRAMGHG